MNRLHLALLALLLLQSSFLLINQFGFYEDDYALVVPYLEGNAHQLASKISWDFQHWPHGRPLNHTLPALCAGLYPWGGRLALYGVLFLIHWLNAVLIYRLSREFLSPGGAFLAGCAYIVFPGDTSRLLLTHVHVFGALTMALLALVFRSRPWAYGLALLTLTSYESAFLVFLLGKPALDGRLRRHLVVCCLILLIPLTIRVRHSEARLQGVIGNPANAAHRSVSSLAIGPPVSLSAFPRAWAFAIHHNTLMGVLLIVTAGLILVRCPPDGTGTGCRRLFWTGTFLWVGGYALTLVNYPPTQVAGRLTTTHLVAALGLAWMIAAATEAAGNKWAHRLTCLGLAVCMPWLWQVQLDYAQAWKLQRAFWTEVVEVCPDLREGDQVVIEGCAPQPASILAHSWADPVVLRIVFGYSEAGLHWVADSTRTPEWLERNFDGSLSFFSEPWYRRRPNYRTEATLLVRLEGAHLRRLPAMRLGEIELLGRAPPEAQRWPSLSRFAREEILLRPPR